MDSVCLVNEVDNFVGEGTFVVPIEELNAWA